ncbi:MAG: lactate permease LctP family transporter [Desulfocapsaceae bacterium]|nr:lactate permease LctP family transporter [Desulfocapsaceae bacterium]
MWTQVVDPLGNIGLSALVAGIPVIFLFWALAWMRMKGHWAALGAVVLAIGVAVLVYGMPAKLALLATLNGGLFGIFPVCWIIVTALFIYNLSVKTGQFEIIKNSLASITDDRRMQALLIAFSFGAFLEGAAGFGTPVAITAAMLTGLGFNPLYAAGVCLIANTAPVAFGAIGIPIVVAGQVSGIPDFAISQMVGRTLPFLSVVIPLYLTILMSGWKKGLEVWPACLVCGVSFALVQFLSANYLGPLLPDILASIASIISVVLFLKVWHPKESWHFSEEKVSIGREQLRYTGGQVFRAWAPFIILSIFVAAWGVPCIKVALDKLFLVKFQIDGLHNMVLKGTSPLPAVYALNLLSAAGTAILFAGVFSIPVMGASLGTALWVAGDTVNKLKWPIVTIALILGFAYIFNFSGMVVTLGNAFAATGVFFPFFAPFLGWLGVFMTGSDTSSNAFFSKLHVVTAQQIGVDPVVLVAANSSGGVCGKMISPQSIAVATSATGLVGKESDIFRFTLKHSIILTAVVGVMVALQAYAVKWIIPVYQKVAAAAPAVVKAAAQSPAANGTDYLVGTFVIALAITLLSMAMGKMIEVQEGSDSIHFH